MDIRSNVIKLLQELAGGNSLGEKITLVAATKTRTAEEISLAIEAGIEDVGENKVQEFTAKYDLVRGGNRHFIGHLQTNKVKYLIGKTYLYHSLDRDELLRELSKRSKGAGVTSDVLIEVNIGCEESKSGYPLPEALKAYERAKDSENIRVRGFMAMLPEHASEHEAGMLCDEMRLLYDETKKGDANIEYLSMGMSGDYRLCLSHGSNMIRLGTAIFGPRNYTV